MRKILPAILLAAAVCGCAVPPRIRDALKVQARYTRAYVEATAPLLESSGLPEKEELGGIGTRLIRNADALKVWANPADSSPREEGAVQ